MDLDPHARYESIDTGRGHYIKFFVDPIIEPLRLISQQIQLDDIVYVGLSGGGWTGIVASAMPELNRINQVILVAGFLPSSLRLLDYRDVGDAEQFTSRFYKHYPYYKLVDMAASIPGRRIHLIYNTNDPCCFGGEGARAFAAQLSGKYSNVDVILRAADTHDFDPDQLAQLIN